MVRVNDEKLGNDHSNPVGGKTLGKILLHGLHLDSLGLDYHTHDRVDLGRENHDRNRPAHGLANRGLDDSRDRDRDHDHQFDYHCEDGGHVTNHHVVGTARHEMVEVQSFHGGDHLGHGTFHLEDVMSCAEDGEAARGDEPYRVVVRRGEVLVVGLEHHPCGAAVAALVENEAGAGDGVRVGGCRKEGVGHLGEEELMVVAEVDGGMGDGQWEGRCEDGLREGGEVVVDDVVEGLHCEHEGEDHQSMVQWIRYEGETEKVRSAAAAALGGHAEADQ